MESINTTWHSILTYFTTPNTESSPVARNSLPPSSPSVARNSMPSSSSIQDLSALAFTIGIYKDLAAAERYAEAFKIRFSKQVESKIGKINFIDIENLESFQKKHVDYCIYIDVYRAPARNEAIKQISKIQRIDSSLACCYIGLQDLTSPSVPKNSIDRQSPSEPKTEIGYCMTYSLSHSTKEMEKSLSIEILANQVIEVLKTEKSTILN